MAWIELHQSVWTHRKTLALADALGIQDTYAAAHMAQFWCWAMDNARNGDVTVMSQRIISKAAGWLGDADVFCQAVIASGFLDKTTDGLFIHNWDDYSGKLMQARENNKERQRRYRERNANVTVMSPSTVTLPLPSTQPNPTVPIREENTPSISPHAKGETTTKGKKRVTEITPEFIEKMKVKYHLLVHFDEHLQEALGHKNLARWDDKQAYLNGWLRREIEKNGSAHGSTETNPLSPNYKSIKYTLPKGATLGR